MSNAMTIEKFLFYLFITFFNIEKPSVVSKASLAFHELYSPQAVSIARFNVLYPLHRKFICKSSLFALVPFN